jgi:hypothetical protein
LAADVVVAVAGVVVVRAAVGVVVEPVGEVISAATGAAAGAGPDLLAVEYFVPRSNRFFC